jgi:hypothetical protein
MKCWLKYLSLFLISFFILNLVSPTCLFAGQNSSPKITTSDFQECLEKVESCNKGYEKLEQKLHECALSEKEDKILFIIPARDVGNIAIGFLLGAILL